VRGDRGGEFWSKEMQSYCASKGIVHQKTNPYSSQENGVAERLNRTLMEKARAMLQGSSLSDKYWGEAVLTASYVRNRTVVQVHGKTPLELLTGKKPRVENLQVFGTVAYVYVPQQKRKKLDAVAEKGIFLGYEANTMGYHVLNMKDKKIMVSKDVTFVENNRTEPSEEIWERESGESALPGTTSISDLERESP
jgi:transposase InsO family protein